MIMDGMLERTWKETFLPCFHVSFQHLYGFTEKRHRRD